MLNYVSTGHSESQKRLT